MQPDFKSSEGWLKVAVGALMLGGLLSLVLVIGRMPHLNKLITDPEFARKCLVIHVNLAIYVWLFSCLAAAFSLIPTSPVVRQYKRGLFGLGIVGVIVFASSGLVPGVRPVMSNYIPVLDNPVFLTGLGIFTLALCLLFLDPRLWRSGSNGENAIYNLPLTVQDGLRAAALAFLLAVVTFLVTWVRIDPGLESTVYYNLLFWGGGHVMQFASVLGMMVAWLILIDTATRQELIPRRVAQSLFGLLVMPLLIAPFMALQIDNMAAYLIWFTRLMQFGILPAILLFLFFIGRGLWQNRRSGKIDRSQLSHPALVGVVVSAMLSLTGMGIGAMIRSANTFVPAHYHASIGAVTVAYMAMIFVLLPVFGYQILSPRLEQLSRWQPACFGLGQVTFAIGFAMAGMTRKVYGIEQVIRTPMEYIGMMLMGLGGFMAIVGGLVFLWIIGAVWFHHHSLHLSSKRSLLWKTMSPNISSKN